MKGKKSFKRTLKLIFGVILLLLILSEVFIVLEAMGFGLAIGNGALSIVLTVVSIAAVAAGYHILSKKLLKPLAEMDEAAVELAAGNLNVDVRHKSEDEMGYLADSFRNLIAGENTIINDEQFLDAEMIREVNVDGRRRSYLLTDKGRERLNREYQRLRAQAADYERIFGKEEP